MTLISPSLYKPSDPLTLLSPEMGPIPHDLPTDLGVHQMVLIQPGGAIEAIGHWLDMTTLDVTIVDSPMAALAECEANVTVIGLVSNGTCDETVKCLQVLRAQESLADTPLVVFATHEYTPEDYVRFYLTGANVALRWPCEAHDIPVSALLARRWCKTNVAPKTADDALHFAVLNRLAVVGLTLPREYILVVLDGVLYISGAAMTPDAHGHVIRTLSGTPGIERIVERRVDVGRPQESMHSAPAEALRELHHANPDWNLSDTVDAAVADNQILLRGVFPNHDVKKRVINHMQDSSDNRDWVVFDFSVAAPWLHAITRYRAQSLHKKLTDWGVESDFRLRCVGGTAILSGETPPGESRKDVGAVLRSQPSVQRVINRLRTGIDTNER